MESSGLKRPLYHSFLAGLVFICALANGQLTRPGSPLPFNFPGLKETEIYVFGVSEEEKKKAVETQDGSMLKPARSGILIETSLNPGNSGTWDTLADNSRVWRCGFHVDGARLMNLIFKPYQVKKGIRIYIYDPPQVKILGAFSDLNNKSTQVLATGQIPGETLIIEMHVPAYADSPGLLTISKLGCDFERETDQKSRKDGWYGLSGDCNEDINCLNEPSYQLVKNAVVRIVYMGGERCTGTLLNNTRQDGRNYVLTAEHCIHTEDNANTAIFYFSYESPFCSGPDGLATKSVSGATIRATSNNLDFSLLELLEPVPVSYHSYFAGWDNTANPPASAFCIHHPQGDVKKISIENDPLTIASFGDKYDPNKHWRVSSWETGTTEAGSSGGGLFDPHNRLRGSLTGGQATCGNSVNDYFQMFSHDWNDYPMQSNQLAYWLDPLNTKTAFLDGYDPNEAFWSTGDTLSNIGKGETLALDGDNLAWGSWSGHNSLTTKQFAEHFSHNNRKRMLGIILQVAHNYIAHVSSGLRVKIWQDAGLPGAVIYEKEVPLADLSSYQDNFVEFDSAVSIADSFFAGYELFYNNPADTFSTYMAADRTLNSSGTAYVYDNSWQSLVNYSNGLIHTSFGIMPVVFDSISSTGPPLEFTTDIIIHPNPANDFCWIEFKEIQASAVSLSIYNILGELINEQEYGPYQHSIRLETSRLKTGIYLIRIRRQNQESRAKMVIYR